MTVVRNRTAAVPEYPAFRLMLIVLVAACAGHGALAQAVVPSGQRTIQRPEGGHPLPRDLKFSHLTTKDGLAQDHIVAILQDRQGFMWFATGEGLNRYDGNSFVVYKNRPSDPGSISHNFIRDVFEDENGYLWVAAYPAINKFDPRTERTPVTFTTPITPAASAAIQLRASPAIVAAFSGLLRLTAAWTALTRRPKRSRIIAMTATGDSLAGSGVLSRTGIGKSGLSPTAVCFT